MRSYLVKHFNAKGPVFEEGPFIETEIEEKLVTQNLTARVLFNGAARTQKILALFEWCMADAQPGDVRILYYSGHGTNVPAIGSDEDDGLDEVICPHDFEFSPEHYVTDNQIFGIISKVPAGVSVWFLSDSCYSGDLIRKPGIWGKTYPNVPEAVAAKQRDGVIRRSGDRADVLVGYASGCRENETSASTGQGGAFTICLLEALRELPSTTKFREIGIDVNKRLEAKGYEQRTTTQGAYRNNQFLTPTPVARRVRAYINKPPIIEIAQPPIAIFATTET
jgi:hypothetical protein